MRGFAKTQAISQSDALPLERRYGQTQRHLQVNQSAEVSLCEEHPMSPLSQKPRRAQF